MQIALNTDFVRSTGSPEPFLHAMAEAGFTHVHWCHQWNTDFMYGKSEIAQLRKWFADCNLQLLDVHGSHGVEKCWASTEEYRRQAGVELVKNRLELMDEMEATGSLMIHAPYLSTGIPEAEIAPIRRAHEALLRSLDDLLPALEKFHRTIAIENIFSDTFELIDDVLNRYPAEYVGITYDSGHGNVNEGEGIDRLELRKSRLQALHLHDNDGRNDLHQPPFYGTLDWQRMVRVIKSSSYAGTGRPLSFEISMRHTPFFKADLDREQRPEDVQAFLRDAYEHCAKVVNLYQEA